MADKPEKIDYLESLMEIFIKDPHTGSNMRHQIQTLLNAKRAEKSDEFVSAPIKVPDPKTIEEILDDEEE